MPKFEVTKTVWGRGERRACIVVEASTKEEASTAFWNAVETSDWVVTVDPEDSESEVVEVLDE
jgi:hypothetical protein